jgi:peptidoglycan/xylan/chitin deacetylase (PgdA/CDA1 family)
MRRRRKLHALVVNPLFIVLPLVVLLWLSWNHFIVANHYLTKSADNLLPGYSFTKLGANGIPDRWQLKRYGDLDYASQQTKGYVNNNSLELLITNYRSGNLDLYTPKVTLAEQTTYLFKGFYSSTSGFDLLANYQYRDGHTQLVLLGHYPPTASATSWSTASTAFNTANNISAVQFLYRISKNGHTSINNFYLEPSKDVFVATPLPSVTKNNIPNPDLAAQSGTKPLDWSSYHTGKNRPRFSYAHQETQSYVKVRVSSYKNGEAKWQYTPLPVLPGESYSFGVSYRSTAPAQIVAEYVLKNRKHKFVTLDTLHPADKWTYTTQQLDVPPNATTMFVSLVLHHNGTLASTNYSLENITKVGSRTWQQPFVSLTFSDGWQSVYENAWPRLKHFGLPASFYVNPGTIDTRHFINDGQIKDLDKHGSEVTSEGYDRLDLTTLDSSHLSAELEESRNFLQTNFGQQSSDFAAPFGTSDPQVEFYARKYYQSEIGGTVGVNTRQNFNPYDLKVMYINANTTVSELRNALKQVKAEKGWLILAYHQVTPDPLAGAPSVPPASFNRQLQAIKQSSITVKTVSSAVHELGVQNTAANKPSGQLIAPHAQSAGVTSIPDTGPGNTIGLFIGATIGGAGIHSLLTRKREQRK